MRRLILLFLWILGMQTTSAQSVVPIPLAPAFLHLSDHPRYRISCPVWGDGAVTIGNLHGSNVQVGYETDPTQWDASCWWEITSPDNVHLVFRNVATGDYLTYTPAKDWTTYVRLVLSQQLTAQAQWTVGTASGSLVFHYAASDANYFMEMGSKEMVSTSAGSGSSPYVRFLLYDESGNAISLPAATPLLSYADQVALNSRLLTFDTKSSTFFSSVATLADATPEFSFQTADDATYRIELTDTITGEPQTRLTPDLNGQTRVLTLFRNDEAVVKSRIAFTALPIVNLSVAGNFANDYTPATLRLDDGSQPSLATLAASVRQRGATARNYPKQSLNVRLLDSQGEELDTTLLGIREDDKWILDAMAIDRIRMRNRICFDLWNEISRTPYSTDYGNRNGTEGQFVELFLNGSYYGIYCLTDRINRKLLDLKKPVVNADTTSVTIRGVLYKSNSWDNTDLRLSSLKPSQPMDTVAWNNWELETPDEFPSATTWQPLVDLYEFCSSSASVFDASVEQWFYTSNVIDFHLLVLAANLIDNGNKNLFLSTPNLTKGHRYLITPWDMDTSLGGYYDGRYHSGTYDNTAIADMRINKNLPFSALWNNNTHHYSSTMAERWLEIRNKAFSQDSINAKLERYAQLFTRSGAWQREVSRWSAGTPVSTDLLTEIAHIEQWYASRLQQMDDYFKPLVLRISGVQQNDPQDDLIWTLDGRLIGKDKGQKLPHGVYIINKRKVVR